MRRTTKRKPTTPGEMLSEEFLIPAELTQSEFALHLGVDVKTINRLINGRTRLTPALAYKIAAALNTTPDFWMNLQMAVDLYDASADSAPLPLPLPQFQHPQG